MNFIFSNKHEENNTISVVSIETRELEEEKEVGKEGLISTEEQEKDPEETEIREKEGEEPEEERIKEHFPLDSSNEWKIILSIVDSSSF
jgi:hypothetical protein